MPKNCPALLLAAPASGSGKTSLTAALARLHVRAGRRVRVFKCGPDFLDPQIHEAITGAPCHNIDLWMCGEEDAARRLAEAADQADLILVEGVMGLFDGTPSSADIAAKFGLPVLAVIDASAMAQTFAAVAHGLATFRPGLPFHGVLANRVAGAGHAELLRAALPASLRWCGAVRSDEAAALPERHLGLLAAAEIGDLLPRLDRLADQLAATPLAQLPPTVEFARPATKALPALLRGRRIAVALDAAFCFIYPANLETLRGLGAELSFFSPLAGEPLPDCDAAWLPGGYPELHAAVLSAQRPLWAQLSAHVGAGKSLLAECGGMMALFDRLIDQSGRAHAMAGLLQGSTIMQERLAALGAQQVALPGGMLRGHTFHHSRCETPLTPALRAETPDGRPGEAIYRVCRLTASYVHFYFASQPEAAARLFAE
jgi:cobyrinic acid a,c-diamide synthase